MTPWMEPMNVTLRSRVTLRLLAVSLAGMVGLAACGSSGSSGASAESTAAAGDASTETTAKKSSGGAATSGDISAGMVAAFKAVDKGDCGRAKEIGDGVSFGDSADAGDASATMRGIAQAMTELSKSGPSALRADFGKLGKSFGDIAKAYEELGIGDPTKMSSVMSDPAKAAEFAKLGESMNSAEVKTAMDNITKWIEERCPGMNDDETTDSSAG